jgi:branched-chain amino acid aminotransferase
MTEQVAYLNGEILPLSQAKISVFDRGFRVGDGVFDTARSFRHKPYKLREHLERLYRSMRYVRINAGIDIDELEKITRQVVAHNAKLIDERSDLWMTQVVSRGVYNRKVGITASSATVAVVTEPINFSTFAKFHRIGMPLITPSIRHTPPECLDPRLKTTSRMNLHMAELEAQGHDPSASALLVDLNGNITEYTSGNFFIAAGGELYTPHEKTSLAGIARATVIDLAREQGIVVHVADITPYDVYNATEAFITSTSKCILPVGKLNGIRIGSSIPGPIAKRLLTAWSERVGVDIVEQALWHLPEEDRRRLDAAAVAA